MRIEARVVSVHERTPQFRLTQLPRLASIHRPKHRPQGISIVPVSWWSCRPCRPCPVPTIRSRPSSRTVSFVPPFWSGQPTISLVPSTALRAIAIVSTPIPSPSPTVMPVPTTFVAVAPTRTGLPVSRIFASPPAVFGIVPPAIITAGWCSWCCRRLIALLRRIATAAGSLDARWGWRGGLAGIAIVWSRRQCRRRRARRALWFGKAVLNISDDG